MEVTLPYISLSVFLLLVAFKFLSKARTQKNLPPSPPALPVISHLHLLKQPLHHTLHQLSQNLGSVFSLRFGSHLVVVVSSPFAVEECFTKNDVVLANRPRVAFGKYLGYNYTTIVAASFGDHWRNLHRIMVVEIFSTSRLNAFLSIRQDEIKLLLPRLSQNLSRDFKRVELKPKWIDYHSEKNLGRIHKKMDAFLQDLINEHRRDKSKNTMIDHLLSLQESHPDYYADEIIRGLILVMILGGTNTSAVTVEWTLSLLVNHPEVLKKARAKVDTHVGQERLIDEPDLSKLHYLQVIISETFRLFPTELLLLPHISSDDCIIEGYNMPRDTILLVNAWAIHGSPKVWDDPTSFKPEWFEGGEVGHKLMPFGLGRRACLGAGMAQRIEETFDLAEGSGLATPKVKPLEAMYKVRNIVDKVLYKVTNDV
ncbi:hypothetical protein CsSME_00003667 [Camellia sinensis var. sinensis]